MTQRRQRPAVATALPAARSAAARAPQPSHPGPPSTSSTSGDTKCAPNAEAGTSQVDGLTVAQVLHQRWGAHLPGDIPPRFTEPGWTYEQQVPRTCPRCTSPVHALRRPYTTGNRTYRYVAVLCPACPRAYTLSDFGVKTYHALLTGSASAVKPVTVEQPDAPGPVPERPRAAEPQPPVDPPPGVVRESARALLWCKTTDPAWRPPESTSAAAYDIKVIVPPGEEFETLRQHVTGHGGQVRSATHWIENEEVHTAGDGTAPCALTVRSPAGRPVTGADAAAARDAFALQWDALEDVPANHTDSHIPVTDLVSEQWQPLLPHPTFNPLQQAAVPALLHDNQNLVVVAPTGAGKTQIGMVAALHAHAGGRKAAWLVPQRSLTDELDQELGGWRRAGLRIARLTGEAAVDIDTIRSADMWVATTEKFEAICRTASLRAVLAEVGCLIVDEIHLLGDPTRGPVLEAVLTRVRHDGTHVRIVGLSATVANADQLSAWLGARLVRSPWRPTRLMGVAGS